MFVVNSSTWVGGVGCSWPCPLLPRSGHTPGYHYVSQQRSLKASVARRISVLPHPPTASSFCSSEEDIQDSSIDICMQFDHGKHGRDGSKGQTNKQKKRKKGTHCVHAMGAGCYGCNAMCVCGLSVVSCFSPLLFTLFSSFSLLTLYFFLSPFAPPSIRCVCSLSFLPFVHSSNPPLSLTLLPPPRPPTFSYFFSSSSLFFS